MRKGFKKKIWLFVGVILMVAAFGSGFVLGFKRGKEWEGYKITRVVDGDTLGVTDLRTGRDWRLRLWGIDAPEAKECGAKESREDLEKIVGGREAEIKILGVDGFGRYIGRVWVGDDEVSSVLVADGMAKTDVSTESVDEDKKPTLADIGQLRRLEDEAKKAEAGIWGSLCRQK